MGQTLSEPVTEKHSESGADDYYAFAVSEMQGWRVSMEDAHTTLLNLDQKSGNAFFAVFDGHGGSSIAKFAGQHVAERLASETAYSEGDYVTALKKAFLGTDDDLRADPAFFHDPSGCTAVAALITRDRKLYVANAGDSRSVLSLKGESKPMSFDHKPTNKDETTRIVAAGGFVEFGRVNGNLALSRAIGDFEFKNNHSLAPEAQIVTANPDIEIHELSGEEEFLIIACDGIWDCLSSQQAVDMVRRQIAQKKPLQEICEATIQRCCAPDADTGAGIGCDNMTMILVAFLHGRTLDQWYDWVTDRVESKYGYETPEELQQVFAESRILAAQQRAQYRNNSAFGPGAGINLRGPGGFGALARVLSGGGISFAPAPRGPGDPNVLSFGHDEDDDYDDDDEEDTVDTGEGGLFGVNRLRVGVDQDNEQFNPLKQQLDDLETGMASDEMEHDHHNIQEVETKDEEGGAEMKDDFAPRANITLASPSEKQGMIDLGVVQDENPASSGDSLSTSGYSSNGKSWVKLSDPASRSNVSSVGSPLVPIPPSLKDFGKPSPPPEQAMDNTTSKPGPIAEEPLPAQETGRVPDADAHPGLTNGLLDKSEDPIKA